MLNGNIRTEQSILHQRVADEVVQSLKTASEKRMRVGSNVTWSKAIVNTFLSVKHFLGSLLMEVAQSTVGCITEDGPGLCRTRTKCASTGKPEGKPNKQQSPMASASSSCPDSPRC